MPYNDVAFKKSMLTWDAVSKKAPAEVVEATKKHAGGDPEAMKEVAVQSEHIKQMNEKLVDFLDGVVHAKDEKVRVDAAKKALGNIHQYQSFVSSAHLPPEVLMKLKNALAELAKVLG